MKQRGFTLIELLIIIAIIGMLLSIGVVALNIMREKSRNIERISMIKTFEKALMMYYDDNGYYPPAYGHGWYNFKYERRNPGGSCAGSGSLGASSGGYIHFDNSSSSGFLEKLFDEGYVGGQEDWNDPNNPTWHNDRYNCRYVTLCRDSLPAQHNDCVDPEKYFLHCTVEGQSYEAKNDGGTNDNAFESFGPDAWACLTAIPE